MQQQSKSGLAPERPASHPEFMTVGDHPALDFLNTVPIVEGARTDLLQTDQDVLDWMKNAGWPGDMDPSKVRAGSLVKAARSLRDTVRGLVERRKAGKRIDPAGLNAYLTEARSYMELVAEKNGALQLQRRWKRRTAEEILAPLAESAADLLVHGDFELIRGCESEGCVLWFYDRTKSHRRRWCSMAACGNRHKVAEYRKRQQAGA